MKVNFNLIYGGCLPYQKKDKEGNKTNEYATMYNLLELDKEKGIVNSKSFSLAGNNPLFIELDLLSPCIATIDLSATNNYQTLIDIKPINSK